MTYTLIVYFMLGFGPDTGLYERSVTPIADYATCERLESAINQSGSPHLAICKQVTK